MSGSGSDSHQQVSRMGQRFTGNGYDPFDQKGLFFLHSLVHGKRGSYILHDSADVDRQPARRHFTPQRAWINCFSPPCGYFVRNGTISICG